MAATPTTPVATAFALDHIVLVVEDVERALAWYHRHAGLAGDRVEEWRAGQVPFPSLRIDESTIIDLVPGYEGGRGHLDHICLVVSADGLEALRAAPDIVIEDEGERFGARGVAHSIYTRDSEGTLVEFRAYPST